MSSQTEDPSPQTDGAYRVLEMIATGAVMEQVLAELVSFVESQSPGMLASILFLDEDRIRVRHAAAPSLPAAYVKAVDGTPIGPAAGSCGTAMFLKKPVIVTDILEDPLWDAYRELAEPHGLRACWSTPILSREGAVLGSFAMYYKQPQAPGPAELRLAEIASHIAGIAIEHQRAADALRASEEKYRTLFEEDLAANYVVAPAGGLLTCNAAYVRLFGFESVADALGSNLWQRFPSAQDAQSFLALLQVQGRSTATSTASSARMGRSCGWWGRPWADSTTRAAWWRSAAPSSTRPSAGPPRSSCARRRRWRRWASWPAASPTTSTTC